MKKLSFWNSLMVLLIVLYACGNKKAISKSKENSSTYSTAESDTSKSINSTNNANDSVKKNNNTEEVEHYEVIHGAPEQEKIDSIKAAKAKEKNNKPK